MNNLLKKRCYPENRNGKRNTIKQKESGCVWRKKKDKGTSFAVVRHGREHDFASPKACTIAF